MHTRSASNRPTLSRTHRVLVVIFAVGAVAAMTIGVAAAQNNGGQEIRERVSGRRVGVGDVHVAEGESITSPVIAIDGNAFVDGSTTKDVFVISGDAVIKGRVGGDVVVIDGNAKISGRVDGDVVALSGRATVNDGALVTGDVRSSKDPHVSSGARVRGEVKHIDVTGFFTALGFSILGFIWLAVTVSTAILGAALLALFRRPFDAAAATARASKGKSIGWGLLILIALPVITVVASLTLFGLPLGLGIGGGLGLLATLGYLTSGLFVGRLMIKAPRSIFGAFFAGWAILRVLALIPGIGVLVWIAASIFGVGALAVTAWRASRGTADETPPEETPPEDTPPAVADSTGEPTTAESASEPVAEAGAHE
jgi:cytoskeletal protein CcmA (bactofilin family)